MTRAEYFAELTRRIAQSRDKAAFVEVFDYYAPRLKAYLMRLGTDGELAEELTQEVMITLWRKAHLFDCTKSSLATWLYRIARNRRIDVLRRDRGGELDPTEPMLQPEPLPDADTEIDAHTREVRVRAALGSLPKEQRELIKLAFFDAKSHSEIADETGLPLGTVKSRIRLAFTRLRRTLEADAAVDVDMNV